MKKRENPSLRSRDFKMKPRASEQRKKLDFKPRESSKKGKPEKPRTHSRGRQETRQRLSESMRRTNVGRLKGKLMRLN